MTARGAGESALLLLDVAQLLTDDGVQYAVIGAMAAAVHGSIRATTNADALLAVSPSRLVQLEKALRKAGFGTELRRGNAADPIPALLVVRDRFDNRVDLLAGLRGLDPQAFKRSITVPFQGRPLCVIGREDFIAMKCYAGGPLDIADARLALGTAEARVNVDLLRRTTRRFGRAAADALEQLLCEP